MPQSDRLRFLTQINAVSFSLDTDLHRLTLFFRLIEIASFVPHRMVRDSLAMTTINYSATEHYAYTEQ